jgi:4-diphosphocytidyl-2-C-methyl-D-erythritol kinase
MATSLRDVQVGTLRVPAPAKLNLYLHVIGRRADGYHLLDSLVAFASVHDTVTVEACDSLTLTVRGPFAPALAAEPDNLALQAARLLAREAAIPPNARIVLEKRVPVASGIGGGSADAAATLKALAALWGLALRIEDMMALALKLGADVPMCFFGRAAFVGGIGEALAPAPHLPQAALLLVNPGIHVPTAGVFQARTGAYSAAGRFAEAPRDAARLAALLAERRNDLTEPACRMHPEIGTVLRALADAHGCLLARMSGSGATCFGLFAEEAAAEEAGVTLSRPGWWVVPARLIADASVLAA